MAVRRLDEEVTKWNGTNFEIFSPVVDCLIPMICGGGLEEDKARHAANILVRFLAPLCVGATGLILITLLTLAWKDNVAKLKS